MGRVGSESPSCGGPPTEEVAGHQLGAHSGASLYLGPQAETLDRLLGRTEAELGAAMTRRSLSLFAILRANYRARTSYPKR